MFVARVALPPISIKDVVMRTRLIAVVATLALAVVGAGPAAATGWHWPADKHGEKHQEKDCFSLSAHKTIKGKDGRATGYTWHPVGSGGHWAKDKKSTAGWGTGWTGAKKHKGWDDCDEEHPYPPVDECEEPTVPPTPEEPEGPDAPQTPDEPEAPDTPDEGAEGEDEPAQPEEPVEDSGVLDSGVTAGPPSPAAPAGGVAPAATPVVAEPTFAG